MTTPKIPLNTFAIPLGLAGLGEVWTVLGGEHHAPALVGDVIMLIAAAAWVAVVAAYLSYLITTAAPAGKAFSADFLDPIGSPFGSLAVIVPVALASDGLYPHAAASGRVITDVFIALTVLLGSWFTGQWIYGPLDLDRFHPGYFLPTVAGGLIAAEGAALVGQRRLAEVLLGLGVMSWVVVGSLILGRLFFRPLLPPPLQPTMAIEVAPAAVSTAAWFAIHGRGIDIVTAFLAGYGMLMVLAQLRLRPAYLRLKFMPPSGPSRSAGRLSSGQRSCGCRAPSRRVTAAGSTSWPPLSPLSSALSPSARSSRSAATSTCPARPPQRRTPPGPQARHARRRPATP